MANTLAPPTVGTPVVTGSFVTIPLSDWPEGAAGYFYTLAGGTEVQTDGTAGTPASIVLDIVNLAPGSYPFTVASVDSTYGGYEAWAAELQAAFPGGFNNPNTPAQTAWLAAHPPVNFTGPGPFSAPVDFVVPAPTSIPPVPTASADPDYTLEQTTVFNTTKLPSVVQTYAAAVLNPAGYIDPTHLVPTTEGLLIKGYTDPVSGSVGGITGAGFDIVGSIENVGGFASGGFDFAIQMSEGNWDSTHLVIMSWPDGAWGDGELDGFEGSPASPEIFIHEIGSDPAENVWSGRWPAEIADGNPHVLGFRWDQVNGYRFLLDGVQFAQAKVSSTVTIPTVSHHIAIQLQDVGENSTLPVQATVFWTARYAYTPVVAPTPPTPPAPPTPLSGYPDVPASQEVPVENVLSIDFTQLSGSYTVTPAPFTPSWFGTGNKQNGTIQKNTNVSFVKGVGMEIQLLADGSSGIISSNPSDGQHNAENPGLQLQPTADAPVFVQFKFNGPPTAANVKLWANWIQAWLTGQNWPENGEIDVAETLSGLIAAHTQWGTGSTNLGGMGQGSASTLPGSVTVGVLWSVTGCTFFYNGLEIWDHPYTKTGEATAMNAPKFIVFGYSLPISTGVDLLQPATLTCTSIEAWQGAPQLVPAT